MSESAKSPGRLRKLSLVTRFELAEALRSRLVLSVLTLYGAGAALGAYLFARALAAAEEAARASLPDSLGARVPDDLVRRQALPRVLSGLVRDPALREELSQVEPLAIFYGFMALQLVGLLVLVTSGGAHGADLARGSVRFVLTRCDRLTWALGKLLGHAALLGLGLFTGAAVTLGVGLGQHHFDLVSALWLMRAALRAWVYGLAYLGIFAGVALIVRRPAASRAFSILLWFGLVVAHGLTQSEWLLEAVPGAWYASWVFPAQYETFLWSPSPIVATAASLALLTIASGGFALGYLSFRRGDA